MEDEYICSGCGEELCVDCLECHTPECIYYDNTTEEECLTFYEDYETGALDDEVFEDGEDYDDEDEDDDDED